MEDSSFQTDVSRVIWETKYRYRGADVIHDQTIDDTWQRIAHSLASVESVNNEFWEQAFYSILKEFRFLPAGRIQAGAGTDREVTLFNCFVMGRIDDSMDGIFTALKEGAITMQQGGGVGYDFSTLRPRGTPARRMGSVASGPVSFMQIWDSMCATLLSTGARRGAMMATLRCDHPDIEEFIDAKRDSSALRNFNLSVLITDAFMQAVKGNADWPLVFPADVAPIGDGQVTRHWPGYDDVVDCRVLRQIPARQLWNKLMRATYDYAEPGVLFVDHINRANNLYYREQISATNPCGEVPLPPYGACNLGSINLTQFINKPFTHNASVDAIAIAATVTLAVRLMDNIISTSRFPLAQQQQQAQDSRRIGLGVTGLADALIMLGLRYDADDGRRQAANIMRMICQHAYRASTDLAIERGNFSVFDSDAYLAGEFIRSLPDDIRATIKKQGIRNSHLIAIAPAGTISLLANNVSSGIEPLYDFSYSRKIRQADGEETSYHLVDYACQQWRQRKNTEPFPETFVRAWDVSPQAHLQMQAAIQPYVDSAISKTINIPADYPFNRFQSLYENAFSMGLKGCTTFRPNPVTGEVLSAAAELTPENPAHHCCTIEREID
ncbi:MAG: adenosylcobalamin-dependent ribonucleoside-diphosphate reductase [Acidiferrobacterales bacterium]